MIHRDGTGPQAQTVLYTVPDITPGAAVVAVDFTVSNGTVSIDLDNDDSPLSLGANGKRFGIMLVEPGLQVKYTVTGASAVWSFDFYLGYPADLASE